MTTTRSFGSGRREGHDSSRFYGRELVAPQIWCKCRGRKLRLLMLRGRCDDVVYLLPASVLARRTEQLVA